jgi:hypothetical protein
MLNKGIREIINTTEDDLISRGYLEGSVLFKPVLSNIADLVILAGSKHSLSNYFLTYYAQGKNTEKFEDLELIDFYNSIIDLWTQNKVSQKVDTINIDDQEPTQPKNGKKLPAVGKEGLKETTKTTKQ